MSPFSWLALLVIYFLNLIVGMFLFNWTECPKELEDLSAKHKEDIKLAALMKKMENMMVYEELEEILEIWSGRGVTGLDVNVGNNSE